MILTLALAAAVAAGPDVFIDEDGCRWLKKTAPAARVVPRTVQHAASAPAVKPKPKKRNFLPKPIEGFDPIGCDEGAAPPAFTFIAPPEIPPAEYTPVPPEFEPMLPPEGLYAAPTTFVEGTEPLPGCECGGGPASIVFVGSGGGGGGGGVFVPSTPVLPVPEPPTWLLMLATPLLWARRGVRAFNRYVDREMAASVERAKARDSHPKRLSGITKGNP